MKEKVFIFICALFLSFNAYAQDNGTYAVNFKNVPMKDFITFVSEFTGKNVIYNEADLRGNVTISSQKNMDSKEILDIFYSVMKLNGYQPVTKGGTNLIDIAHIDTISALFISYTSIKLNKTNLQLLITF